MVIFYYIQTWSVLSVTQNLSEHQNEIVQAWIKNFVFCLKALRLCEKSLDGNDYLAADQGNNSCQNQSACAVYLRDMKALKI